METFLTILSYCILAACSVIIVLAIMIITAICLSKHSLWFEELYMKRFDLSGEYKIYRDVLNKMENGLTVPIVYLCDYTRMQVYEPDKWNAFIKDNEYYIVVFPDGDISLFTNNKNVICSFYKFSLKNICSKNGYTDEEIKNLIKEGKDRNSEFEIALTKKIGKLEKLIGDLKEKTQL